MENRKISMLLLSVSFVLSGCASKPVEKPTLSAYEMELLAEHKRTEDVIAKAALLSSRALSVYVRTNQALVQPLLTAEQIRQAQFQDSHIPNGMEPILQRGYDGPPEPLIARIASEAGYRVEYANQRPPLSRGITMSSDPRNLRAMLAIVEQQSVGYIEKMNIIDTAQDKLIRIHYAKF